MNTQRSDSEKIDLIAEGKKIIKVIKRKWNLNV